MNSGLPGSTTQIFPCVTQTKGPELEHHQHVEASRANQAGNLRAARDLEGHLSLFTVPKGGMGKVPTEGDSLAKITQENSGGPRTKAHLEGILSA